MDFMSAMKNTLDDRKVFTENGAIGYATTGHELLDLNFKISSLRNRTENEIKNYFAKAYYEEPLLALKWMMYLGDVRGGTGERRSFNVCTSWLAENKPEVLEALLILIPEYTRWDNLINLIETPLREKITTIINDQLVSDVQNAEKNKSVSLAAKWLPSENSKKEKHRKYAKILMEELKLTPKMYRKMLSALRAYIDLVEVKMSAQKFGEIDYKKVPSKANLIYSNAFMRHDPDRRKEYLEALKKGETTINSFVAFPHEIVHKYFFDRRKSDVLEEMWKALPDFVQGKGNTLVVGDGSGSMYTKIDRNSSVQAIEVSIALAIYFSERLSGAFQNRYIEFGSNPLFVDFTKCNDLRSKIDLARKHSDCGSTDIWRVFNLILMAAVGNKLEQSEIPDNVLILSDMEYNNHYCFNDTSKALFEKIASEYAAYGYKMPKLIFWNLASRSDAIPLKENDNGVVLVSGFSPAVCKMVLSNKLDPYKAMLDVLNSDRYKPVEDTLAGVEL